MRTADTPRMRTLARAVALAALLAALPATGCGAGEPERDAAGRLEQAGETRLLKLRVGDCVGNLQESLDSADGGHNGVPEVEAVPCSDPHDAELLRIGAITGSKWPGQYIVDRDTARGRRALQPRLTAALARAGKRTLTLLNFRPTRQRWDFEDQHATYFFVLYDRPQRGTL